MLELFEIDINVNAQVSGLIAEPINLLVDTIRRCIKVRCVEIDCDGIPAVGAYDARVSLELPDVVLHRIRTLRTFHVNGEVV